MRAVPFSVCLQLIFQFEGDAGKFRPVPAQDPVGNWEIGWGHKLAGPHYGGALPLGAEALARADLTAAAVDVCNVLGPAVTPLTDNQYGALIDFTFNEGGEHFATSTLANVIKQGMLKLAGAQFSRWIYAHQPDGTAVVEPGLARRRAAEIALWQTNARPA